MVQIMKICVLLLHSFFFSAAGTTQTWDPIVLDTVQTREDSYFPQMQKRMRRSYYSFLIVS